MIVEKVIGNIADYSLSGQKVDKVWIEWYELDKKLLKKITESGEDIGIRIETHLAEGDVLYDDGKKVLVVDLLPCELTAVRVDTMKEMGRLCFELGNRHLSLSIQEHEVTIPYDEPTYLYLKKLGFDAQKTEKKFSSFTICHAHSQSHTEQQHHVHEN